MRIIDRRLNGRNKSAVNRQRFIARYKKQIKNALSKAMQRRNITDIQQGEQIVISSADLVEPHILHKQGGQREIVLPGNREFNKGDKIPRQSASEGTASQASDTGAGEDAFVFQLSREEFFELYFDDLQLPDLIKKQFADMDEKQYRRAGFTTYGVPANINVIRSLKHAQARRISLKSPKITRISETSALIDAEKRKEKPDQAQITLWEDRIRKLKERLNKIPFIDEFDIRYNNRVKVSAPMTRAVMFCIMDVSGSMDEEKKELAKRFFILLYLFLTKTYENIELVFIRHHTSAKAVDENEFFYSRETGGTVVSSALLLTQQLIGERYPPSQWNIYVAQASDGDNWNADSPYCKEILMRHLMPSIQYYAYVEIMPRHHQSLWDEYTVVADKYKNFAMKDISKTSDIYPVFRELFERKSA